MSITSAVHDLIERMKAGDILGAFDTHYADDVVMQEPTASHAGKTTNRAREQAFLDSVKEWKSLNFANVAIEDHGDHGVSFIEYDFDFVNTQGAAVRYEQVARQVWKDGKIVHERFYYNAG